MANYRRSLGRLLQVLAVAAIAFPAVSMAADAPLSVIPENAHKESFGSGWQCDDGYRENKTACEPIVFPEYSYSTNRSYGKGWECLRGYDAIGEERCEKIDVPENGYLSAHGNRWRCLRGFVERANACDAIEVPENGYLSDEFRSRGWACDRGYEVVGSTCVRILVPENGYLTNRSHGATWACERGYRKDNDDACILVDVPENAFFDDALFSLGWACKRGFKPSGRECVEVVVPENAHLNRAGDAWECDRSFSLKSDICFQNN